MPGECLIECPMPVQRITVSVKPASAKRLDELLRTELPEILARQTRHLPGSGRFGNLSEPRGSSQAQLTLSNAKIRRLIISGSVTINGKRENRPAAALRKGDSIIVAWDSERFAFEKKPDDVVCEITEKDVLFEDDLLIAVNKPAGLPTEGTIVGSRDSLHSAVRRYLARACNAAPETELPYAGLHHRLDRETSGVVLFTKKQAANAAVHAMFAEHTARKTYLAIAGRQPINPARKAKNGSNLVKPGDRVTVVNFLGRISPKSARAKWGAVSETEGAQAETTFTVLEAFPGALYLRCEPLTGRTHQIRVHLSGLGAPILGDPLYGGAETLANGMQVKRVMLHAAELSFPHPADGRLITVTAPESADFTECLRRCQPRALQ